MSQINLQDLFGALQTELLGKLRVGSQIVHAPTHGDDTELNWLELLKSLPGRYVVSKGFVVDANGGCSEQIDVIIYDRYYSPLILRRESTLYIPAESVYAVLEIKQNMSKDHIEAAGKKAASVRELSRTSAPIRQIDGSLRRKDVLPPILAGILTTHSDWTPPFGDSLSSVLSSLEESSRLDLGIALNDGSFDCTYTEAGEASVRSSNADVALISFFINLTKQLQLLGNAPGIDLDTYYQCYS